MAAKTEDARTPKTFVFRIEPAYRVVPLDPKLSGYSYVGKDLQDALGNAKSDVMRRFKKYHWPIACVIENPEAREMEVRLVEPD